MGDEQELEEIELPCGIRVVSVPGWGRDAWMFTPTLELGEAKHKLRLPNDWEYKFVDKGKGAWEIHATPIYDDKKPRHILLRDAVVIKNIADV